MIKTFGTIEKSIEALDTKKYTIPEDFLPDVARDEFLNPEANN